MEKLRNARANSKRSFSRINRGLLRHITDKAEPSLVQDCWGELQTAWSDVERKHNDYVSLLSSEQEMEKEDTWMDEMYDIFSTTKKVFFSFNNETMKNVKEETGTNEQNIKQPEIQKLKMPLFFGTQDDVMSFNDFLKMFDDLIGNNSAYNQSAKLMYLKSYLRGNALDTIKHLSTEDKNYTIAKFLTEEYLDTDVIVEEHIRKLHDLTPPPARDLPALRAFFNTARTSVYELKAFGYDALEDGTLGSKIISFIICEKLPVNFKLEHLFSIESLGIRETDESVSARERRLVEEFSNEVELRDGKYFVRVPFYDSVTKVPGNHDIHLSKYSTTMAATALKESLYVDNFIFSTSDEGKLLDIYRDATQIMKEGGFNLRSWMSNFSPLVDIMMSDNMVNEHGAVTEKVLGYFNVADMLTRGLSAKEFHKKLAVWCHGPDWLGDHPEQWPKSPLHCLSEEGKVMVELQQHHQQVEINTEAQTPATQTILSIKDFSSLRRLHGVTARVFHFVNVLKHREADAKEQATHYWLKVMQENAFTEEISYLQDKQENKLANSASVPKLVKELNAFIDKSAMDQKTQPAGAGAAAAAASDAAAAASSAAAAAAAVAQPDYLRMTTAPRSHVAPPRFFEEDPVIWLIQLDLFFSQAAVDDELSRFRIAATLLPGHLLRDFTDILRNPPLDRPYTILSDAIRQRFGKSAFSPRYRLLRLLQPHLLLLQDPSTSKT
ncbi:hypothetical protein FJT64_001918 [Amphibalanus amphitrite]|uniref:DUF7041 domain-containing protein n=1 Tax=Amphibalanus amphitrite TaxID=1232801 RepID=A0A6A4X8S2_AMPAM|nr:hypothetical protein FJT64_001918 [Amphibalanus amphitrite]